MKLTRFGIYRTTLAAVIAMGTSVHSYADWPQFRGPSGQGLSSDARIPVTWDEQTNVSWQKALPGISWSSPVIVGDRIFLTNATDQNGSTPKSGDDQPTEIVLSALCLKQSTGDIIWQKELFRHPPSVQIHKKNSHASPTPVVDGDVLYVHFGPHGTAALNLDGEVLWRQKIEYAPNHGNGGSPALVDDKLILCCDGNDHQFVIALNKSNGEVAWKTKRETTPERGFSFATPLILEISGRKQAVCPASEAVFAYDVKDGQEIWRVDYPGGYSVIPRPVYGEGLVFICTGYNRPTLLAIDPTGTGNVTETHVRWKTDKQVPHSASLLLVNDLLFFVSDKGIARCVDAATGESHWEERLGGNYSASPIYDNGHVYFQDETGTATVIEASKVYKEVAKNKLPSEERTFASYGVSDGAIYLRSEGHLYKIENAR